MALKRTTSRSRKRSQARPLRVLITGATGLLGTHLLKTKPSEVEVIGTIHQYQSVYPGIKVPYIHLDIRNRKDVQEVINAVKPDVVIHTAAHGRLDYCEQNQEDAYQTNVKGVIHLVDALKPLGGKIFFCSTNATYDGYHPLYDEISPQKPTSYYGKTKVKAEKYIRQSGINYTINRLMTMYGWNWQPERVNMVTMLIKKLSSGQKLWMTNDVWNNTLYAHEAAKVFWYQVLHPKVTDRQTFQLAGGEIVNRYQTTMTACSVFSLNRSLVTEVTSDYFEGKEVQRSPNTSFDISKAKKVLKYKPLSLRQGLLHMKKHSLPQTKP